MYWAIAATPAIDKSKPAVSGPESGKKHKRYWCTRLKLPPFFPFLFPTATQPAHAKTPPRVFLLCAAFPSTLGLSEMSPDLLHI